MATLHKNYKFVAPKHSEDAMERITRERGQRNKLESKEYRYKRVINELNEFQTKRQRGWSSFFANDIAKLYRSLHYIDVNETTKDWAYLTSVNYATLADLTTEEYDLLLETIHKVMDCPAISYHPKKHQFGLNEIAIMDELVKDGVLVNINAKPEPVAETVNRPPTLTEKFKSWLFTPTTKIDKTTDV